MTKKLISRIAELSVIGKEGHVPSALSILDIVWVIYNKIININLLKRRSRKRDFFILSKGHGCLAQYVVLEKKGIISKKDLNTFCKYKSNFGGHPDSNKIEGIECSTGSLGHGFPFAAGVAYGNKLLNIKSKVITLVGDGECNEGSIWESILSANQFKLDNITIIIDRNNFQQTGQNSSIMDLKNLKSKFWILKGLALGFYSNLHGFVFKSYSSQIYVFKKTF